MYARLPEHVQTLARKNYGLFRANPEHPSLRFKPLAGHSEVYSVRIGLCYRAVALREGDTLHWFWIGSHADFDKEFA
jgi:hypothetical protein